MPRVRAPLPPAPWVRPKSRLRARASACALQWRSKDEPARGCRRTSARATPTARAAAAQCSPQCCRCQALTVRGLLRPAAAQPKETGKCQRRGTCCLSLKRHGQPSPSKHRPQRRDAGVTHARMDQPAVGGSWRRGGGCARACGGAPRHGRVASETPAVLRPTAGAQPRNGLLDTHRES